MKVYDHPRFVKVFMAAKLLNVSEERIRDDYAAGRLPRRSAATYVTGFHVDLTKVQPYYAADDLEGVAA